MHVGYVGTSRSNSCRIVLAAHYRLGASGSASDYLETAMDKGINSPSAYACAKATQSKPFYKPSHTSLAALYADRAWTQGWEVAKIISFLRDWGYSE